MDPQKIVLAASRNDSCRLLLGQGANVNTQTNTGCASVYQASSRHHGACCKLLIEKGASVNLANKQGHTPLMVASEKGYVDVCKVLIKGGAFLNKQDKSGWAALHFAAAFGRPKCCRLLLQTDAEVDIGTNERDNPLHLASKGGYLESCKALVEFGANVAAVTAIGCTSLYFTCLGGHKECLRFLLAKGASVNIPTVSGYTAIRAVSLQGHVECLRLLLDNGAYLNCWGDSVETPLYCACYGTHVKCVELLLEKGADPSLSGSGLPCPIDVARSKGDLEIVNIIGEYERRRAKDNTQLCEPTAIVDDPTDQMCEHVKICQMFKTYLKVSDAYFEPSYDVCFCERCLSKRGDNRYYTRGVPPKDYGLPIGWVKFGLRAPAKAAGEQAFEKWHVAFHGTIVDCVKQIIKTGDLLMPGDFTPEGARLRPPGNHFDDDNPSMAPPPGHDVSKIYLSPSIRYSGLEVYAPSHRYIDPTTEIIQRARVAFQVRIKPGTYDVGDQTIGARGQIDPKFPNSELEWSTKRRGITILVGLLVKVEGLKEGPSSLDLGSLGPALPQNFQRM